jgi:SAM-dependent MidA family methyltransferase
MTPAGEVLAAEIAREGSISFRRFMEVALYHPEHGYYRRTRDPFGKQGDFFTAEQIQPVFGTLIAARVRQLHAAMGNAAEFTVVELGAGRGEMEEAFREWRYIPVEIDSGELPERFSGVVFSNEFFDALPVEAAIREGGVFRERRVAMRDGQFVWETGRECRDEVAEYLARYFPPPEEGWIYEANLEAARWMERIRGALASGFILTIDYGFTRAEAVRFPAGTLMSYRRHTAIEEVLEQPGERDITAHVNFTALEEEGAARGLRRESFQTLAQLLLAAGEGDQFAAALSAEPFAGRHAASGRPACSNDPATRSSGVTAEIEAEQLRRRMQLKTLLFGMGETFRVLTQRKEG